MKFFVTNPTTCHYYINFNRDAFFRFTVAVFSTATESRSRLFVALTVAAVNRHGKSLNCGSFCNETAMVNTLMVAVPLWQPSR